MGHWLREDYNFLQGNWYRPYSVLNSMPIPPSPETMRMIQINAIKLKNNKLQNEISYLNNFLVQFQQFANQQLSLSNEEDFFSIFMKKLNKGYGFFDMNDMKAIKPSGNISWLQDYLQSLNTFIEFIAKYGGQEIPENIAYSISRIAHHIEQGSFYGFQNRKAQLWEDVSSWILSMAGFGSIGTGAIIDKAGKQLIQDSVGYLESSVETKTQKPSSGMLGMSMRVTGTKTKTEENEKLLTLLQNNNQVITDSVVWGPRGYVSFMVNGDIRDFDNLITTIQHKMNKKITIKINDNTNQYLQQFLSVQAKSGSNQALLNNQKRDLIDIAMLANWDKYISLLNKFYMNFSQSNTVNEGMSDKLAAYTNWIFSKNIAQTTLGKNTFFLSHYGFATLDQTMEKYGIMFKLSPNPNSIKLLCTTQFKIEET